MLKHFFLIFISMNLITITASANQDINKSDLLINNECQSAKTAIDANETITDASSMGMLNTVEAKNVTTVIEPASQSNFSKASLPMKAFLIVATPVVMAGAVVYYVVLAPFALVGWALDSKK